MNPRAQLRVPLDVAQGFLLPQLLLMLSAAFAPPIVTAALLIAIPLAVDRKLLLLNWLGLAFINFALYVPDIGWIGLIPTYYYALVVVLRLDVGLKSPSNIWTNSRLELLGILIILLSFWFLSRTQYFLATAVKSTIQLTFLLLLVVLLRQIDRRWLLTLRQQALETLPIYVALYLVVGVVLWRFGDQLRLPTTDESQDRFGGMLGPQVCAFALTICFALLWFSNQRVSSLVCLFGIALTGSRTYAGIAALIMVIALFLGKAKATTKILAACGLVVFIVLAFGLLPLISDRFVMDDDFYGTLIGRLLNYQSAIEHIGTSPIFGKGMGSMLLVLEDWVPDFFDYYRASGDTTIMHNEYLRILMETGLVGGALVVVYVKNALKVKSAEVKTMVVIMLVASLTENTLAAYSTAMVALLLLATSAAAAHKVAAP